MSRRSLAECSMSRSSQSKPEPATISVEIGLARLHQRPICWRFSASAALKRFFRMSIGVLQRPGCGSAHQAGALVVEGPAGDQGLHRLRVVAGAEAVALVERMRRLDLGPVDLDAEAGALRSRHEAAPDLQR